MSAAFFEETFPIAGQPRIQDAGLIAALLQQASLVVPADELQKHLATLGHSGGYVLLGSDMETMFTKFSSVDARVEPAPPAADGVVETSSEAEGPCVMNLAELEAALKNKGVNIMQSLPQRVKHVVLQNFNSLLLNSVPDVEVDLDQEDVVKIRDDQITHSLPGIIKEALEKDTGLYVTREGGGEHLVLELALLPAEKQEEFRTAWCALSEKKTARRCSRRGG